MDLLFVLYVKGVNEEATFSCVKIGVEECQAGRVIWT